MATRILVVEDDTTLAASISRDLRLQAHDVVCAHDLDEGVRALEKGGFDVLLTDLRMAGGDGIELLRRTRAFPDAPSAILMSGVATARDYQTAVDLGAVRVLTKPFSSAELHSAIRQALECGVGYHGTIHGLGLVDVLQAFHLCRRSVTLHVNGRREGILHMREGEVVHAVAGEHSGEAALRWLIDQKGGHLSTEGLPADELPQTITDPFEMVLLDALRSLDEDHRGPDPTARVELLRELARRLVAAGEPLALKVAIGVVLSARLLVPLRTSEANEAWGAVADELVALLQVLTSSPRGLLESSNQVIATWIIWDKTIDVAVILGDVVRNPGHAAWLRATTVAAVQRELGEVLIAARAQAATAGGELGSN